MRQYGQNCGGRDRQNCGLEIGYATNLHILFLALSLEIQYATKHQSQQSNRLRTTELFAYRVNKLVMM